MILTPRTAAVLRAALVDLSDAIRRDVVQLGDDPLVLGRHRVLAALDRLPRASWGEDAAWRTRFAAAAGRLAAELADGELHRRLSPAEQLCLHLAVEDAADAVDADTIDELVSTLPDDEGDYDWDVLDHLLPMPLSEGEQDVAIPPEEWFTLP